MKWYHAVGIFSLAMYGVLIGWGNGKNQWLKLQNESGIFVTFDRGMIAPHGIVPFIEVNSGDGYKTRIYRTGEVYEVVQNELDANEFHRLNYWVKTHQ